MAKLTLDEKIGSASEVSQETGRPLPAKAIKQAPFEVLLEAGEGRLFLLGR